MKTFNRTNDNEIGYARWTFNPITGCLHGCEYCFAADIARYHGKSFTPTFHPERLAATQNTKPLKNPTMRDKNVLTGTMGDMFGAWVKREWISAVLDSVRKAPHFNFLFLTKNPKRYLEFEFSDNVFCGATVDRQDRVEVTEHVFSKLNAKKFISAEPLIERISFKTLHNVDWLIIGALSKTSEVEERQPKWEWVEALLVQAHEDGCAVYFKKNLKVRPREYPRVHNEGIKCMPLKQKGLFE